MAKKVQLQTNGKEWQVIDGEQVLVDVEKQDIDPITSSSCVQIEGFRTLEEAISDNKMLSQDLTYTKVMDKVGGDYHQNVLDGQYSKAILYGNTQVNLCEEDTSGALRIPTTFTSFNNGELQINNKENQVVAPLIKGVTMVNLAQTTSSSITSGNGLPIHNVKGNTLYTLSFKFTTKNTNSGVVIQSYDANGTYLENTMHKTGLGDDVKFTFTTHANATKVHICNNAAYGGETIQLDEIMLIEGDQTALDIPFFKGMKSVELVRPLTNLFTDDTGITSNKATFTNTNGDVVVTSSTSSSWTSINIVLNDKIKPNTKYLVMWDNLIATQTSTSKTEALISVYGTNNIRLGYINNNPSCPTKRSIIFDTANYDISQIIIRVHATLSNTETATTTVTGLRVFEYDDYLRSVDLQSIGWFSGTKNVAVEPIKTCSKNLYPYGDINFISQIADAWCDAKGNTHMYEDMAQKSKSRFLLKKGIYYYSCGSATNISALQIVDDKEKIVASEVGKSFTLNDDAYLTLRVKTIQANVATTVTNVQIERGSTETDYVAHDSRYYEPDGQNAIVLRGLPNGVCDTFNLQTGEYTRRIGEVVFNGSEEWTQNGNFTNVFRAYCRREVYLPNAKGNRGGITDTFPTYGYNQTDVDSDDVNTKGLIHAVNELYIKVPKSYLTSEDVDGLKQWLSQNPITIQYELKNPITTIIPRTIKRNNNGTVSTVDFGTYTNKESLVLPNNPTFLTINSMTSIKPVVEPITYIDFKTRLKANTDYSVIMDKDSNTSKTINFGGTSKTYTDKMLVRTPSINLEQNLRISGSGSIQNIMVIEGDALDKELPYFNSMCNVKMPIVRNCGKNLFDINDLDSSKTSIINDREFQTTDINLDTYINIKVKPNTTYSICFKAYKDGGNALGLAMCIHDGKNTGYNDATTRLATIVGVPSAYDYRSKVFTTKSDYISLSSLDKVFIKDLTIIESNTVDANYIPYRGNDICIAQGEIGLSQDMFEQGGMYYPLNSGQYLPFEDCKADNTTRIRTKECIPLKPGVAYRISCVGAAVQIYFYDASKKSIEFDCGNTNGLTFTTPNGASYMSLMFRNDSKLSVTDFMNKITFQLLELDSTVQLRSLPNGVKDELNLLTGEYIQRVGEVVFDGSDDEGWHMEDVNIVNHLCFDTVYAGVLETNPLYTNFRISDKFNSISHEEYLSDSVEGIRYFSIPAISVSRSKLNEPNVTGFKQYLSQNPITVQYELAEPIISYPRIVSNTQEREVGVKLPNGVCDTYNPSTGITVKRVGKVILDGSEDWILDTTKTNTQVFKMPAPKDFAPTYFNLIAESLPTSDGTASDTEKIVANQSNHSATSGLIWCMYIALLKTKASTVDELKAYLKSNPLTVHYELANPIVTTDIILPNGVHDDYNPITGLYTKRVGYVELDGSDDETWSIMIKDTNTYRYSNASVSNIKYGEILSNIPTYLDDDSFNTTSVIFGICSRNNNTGFNVHIPTTLANNDTTFRTYLSQNPIKVWFELSTPQKIQLTPYFGLPMPYAYQGGHLIMDSAYDGQTLPPEITYQLIVNRTGQITQNNIKLKEHTARLSNLEYMLIEATLDSIFDREMQNFELELMNVELFNLDE